jgi:hypothetical protein
MHLRRPSPTLREMLHFRCVLSPLHLLPEGLTHVASGRPNPFSGTLGVDWIDWSEFLAHSSMVAPIWNSYNP